MEQSWTAFVPWSCFCPSSRAGSFTETARLFGVTPGPVSRMITQFESELRVKLLLQLTGQVMRTENGQDYACQLEGIFWSITEA